jgi:hypothetical protein
MKNTLIKPLFQTWSGYKKPILFLVSGAVFLDLMNQRPLVDSRGFASPILKPTGQR